MQLKLYMFFIVTLASCWLMETKPRLRFDEFFDYTEFPSLSFSPTGQHLLFQTLRAAWNTSSYERSLWLYEIETQKKKLIAKNLDESLNPKWSPSGHWIAFLNNENSVTNFNICPRCYQRSTGSNRTEQFIYLYSILLDKLVPIRIGTEIPSLLTWSDNDLSLYFVVTTTELMTDKEDKHLHNVEWKDVIEYRREMNSISSMILRIDIDVNDPRSSTKINVVRDVPFLIGELLLVPSEHKLILTSTSILIENLYDFEIYSIDLQHSSTLSRLTNNQAFEAQLQLSNEGKHVIFQQYTLRPTDKDFNDTQRRVFSLDLTSGHIERLAKDFTGNIAGYAVTSDGGLLIRGQVGIGVQIYRQKSSTEKTIYLPGWNGTYERITLSSNRTPSIAFVYSSLEQPKEIYFGKDINQLQSAYAITNENQWFTRREIPKAKVYKWKNEADNATIEGILHYPPKKFEAKQLPLLVLIHGGPYDASLDAFEANWYNWAPLAASNGWLVLEPNYCGSTGYGDQFVNEVRRQPLSRPGRDILAAVDQLIKDGAADPHRLAVGGYSYGGLLTNWLITQTTRFNAALSGAGPLEHVSAWGTMDLPLLFNHLFGGFPWDVPQIYQNQSAIYQLNRAHTPTLIVTGQDDIRVDADQSYILERGLYSLGVPVQLLIFPKEGHELSNNPWHGKIKVREELKWLQKYGHQSRFSTKNQPSFSLNN